VILGRTIPGYVVNLAILGFAVAAEGYSTASAAGSGCWSLWMPS
jgi:hypothetical protein